MSGANDEPGGEASSCSPDVCKMVARVIKRLREHGPLWVTDSTPTQSDARKRLYISVNYFQRIPQVS